MSRPIPFLEDLKQDLVEHAPASTVTHRPRRRMRLGGVWVAAAAFVVTLLVGGLTWILSGGDSAPPVGGEPMLLNSFTSGDVVYEFRTYPNNQGAAAPCVGVEFDLETSRRATMVCPTMESEETTYAGRLDGAPPWTFVVGFGLEPGESITDDAAIRVITTDSIDQRRFFLIQYAQPVDESYRVPVTRPDGTTRFITVLPPDSPPGSTTTTMDPTSSSDGEPFDVVRPVPLTIYAPDANGTTVAAVDLNTGMITTYPQTLAESIQGMSSDSSGRIVAWTYEPAVAVYDGSLTQPTLLLEGEGLGPLANAPSLRATLTTERDGLWIVNPNAEASNAVLFNLVDRQQVLVADVPGNAFPVAARGTGMVFNTERHVESDDGLAVEAGSERVVSLDTGGQVTDLGQGKAIAATDRYIAMLVCPTGTESENCYVNPSVGRNELVVVDTETGERTTVEKPAFSSEPTGDVGDWIPVGGPLVPSEAMPLNTVSPDGTELLVRLGKGVDVNGVPTSSVLLAVDLASGETRIAAESQTETPLATWSRDGTSIITIHYVAEGRIDIAVIEADNPDDVFTYPDLIPDNHFPLAAG